MQPLNLFIKLTPFAEQIIFHDVEMHDGCPERPRYFRKEVEPTAIDHYRRDPQDNCGDNISHNSNRITWQKSVGRDSSTGAADGCRTPDSLVNPKTMSSSFVSSVAYNDFGSRGRVG
jgi:hypothetical protein